MRMIFENEAMCQIRSNLKRIRRVGVVPAQKVAPSGEQGAPGCKD